MSLRNERLVGHVLHVDAVGLRLDHPIACQAVRSAYDCSYHHALMRGDIATPGDRPLARGKHLLWLDDNEVIRTLPRIVIPPREGQPESVQTWRLSSASRASIDGEFTDLLDLFYERTQSTGIIRRWMTDKERGEDQ